VGVERSVLRTTLLSHLDETKDVKVKTLNIGDVRYMYLVVYCEC
jgi:hypothetical protein